MNTSRYMALLLLAACDPSGLIVGGPTPAEIVVDGLPQQQVGLPSVDNDRDGQSEQDGDCNDGDAAIYRNSHLDVTTDGFDQDCDGVDGTDFDGDGHATAALGGDDCDDDNEAVFPGAAEVPYDGVGNDCLSDRQDLQDVDGDGYSATIVGGFDCADHDPNLGPQMFDAEDGIDNNCDGQVDAFSWEMNWDYSPNPGHGVGFRIDVQDSFGQWELQLTDMWLTYTETHRFERECYPTPVDSSQPRGDCIGTGFPSNQASRTTYLLRSPQGECWAWGKDVDQIAGTEGCTLAPPGPIFIVGDEWIPER